MRWPHQLIKGISVIRFVDLLKQCSSKCGSRLPWGIGGSYGVFRGSDFNDMEVLY